MRNKKLFLSFFIFFAILLFSNICFADDLDVINEYTITVNPRSNGTLDITYHLEWKVLNSTSEGPLEWVKIGIPNANVSNITAISKNIKKISYYKDNGDFIRVDFNRSYEANEVLDIDFKFTQSYMYTLSGSTCNYSYTPGWFDDINVKKMVIRWQTKNITSHSPKATTSNGYYVWTTNNLLKGRKYTIEVSYPKSAFETSRDMQASHATVTTASSGLLGSNVMFISILAIGMCLLSFIVSMFSGGGYSSRRGFGYSRYDDDDDDWGSSSSCVSSCACACACAGSGRAGCSKKDLYGTNLRTKKLNKILNA